MNKKIILTGILIFMINHTATNSAECGKSENANYEVSMKYVDYDDLDSADLPPRQRFNLNEDDPEDQALEYQDDNTDTIITIKRNFMEDFPVTGINVEQQEEVQLLDDTGFYTAHFLVQDLMKKANENGEIDPKEHQQQIKIIKEQLEKFKELVEEVKEFNLAEIHTTAADVEDSIGDEWGEGDGVLDVLDKNPINVNELAQHWTTLMNDISSAKDMRIQAYVLDEYSGHWNTVNIPSAWREIKTENILPMYSVKKPHTPVVGVYTAGAKLAVKTLSQQSNRNSGYYAHRGVKDQPLDVLLYPVHCTTVNSRITGQRRSRFGRFKRTLWDGKKKTKNSQGGQGVQ